jgi:hypothetical protein
METVAEGTSRNPTTKTPATVATKRSGESHFGKYYYELILLMN